MESEIFTTLDIENRLFGPIVPGRDCGECNACCIDLNIREPELKKPAGTPCPHLNGKGCGIYDGRPSVCRNWHCLWRRIAAMPDGLRPDRCGVTFAFVWDGEARNPFEHHYVVGRARGDNSDALLLPDNIEAYKMFAEAAPLPLWVSSRGTKTLLFPDPVLAKEILHPTGTSPSGARAADLREQWKWFLHLPLSSGSEATSNE